MWIPLLILIITSIGSLRGQGYEKARAIFTDLLNKSVYNPDLIPLNDQSSPIRVNVLFNLVSIVTVDDTTESFVCNGFLTLYWIDERLRWDPKTYGEKYIIHPLPKKIWRPRVILLNTLDDRDLFADDVSPVIVRYEGDVSWAPGSLFTTSCSLNLLKYPFDEQLCSIQMMSMGLQDFELLFIADTTQLDFFSINGEWDLLDSNIVAFSRETNGANISAFDINIRIKRRPTFYVLNIIFPFVFLSFLNLLVFTIPQESGEKIGYGITVLLALSVFFSIIGGMLPRSSETVPYVVIYLFILYVMSTLAVIDSIFIAFIYHMEERQEYHRKIKEKIKNLVRKRSKSKNTVRAMGQKSTMDSEARDPAHQDGQRKVEILTDPVKRLTSRENMGLFEQDQKDHVTSESDDEIIGYRLKAGMVDFFSGLVFILSWTVVTFWFFSSVVY